MLMTVASKELTLSLLVSHNHHYEHNHHFYIFNLPEVPDRRLSTKYQSAPVSIYKTPMIKGTNPEKRNISDPLLSNKKNTSTKCQQDETWLDLRLSKGSTPLIPTTTAASHLNKRHAHHPCPCRHHHHHPCPCHRHHHHSQRVIILTITILLIITGRSVSNRFVSVLLQMGEAECC